MPCFRSRVYQVSFKGASDVSACENLTADGIVPVIRRRLWASDTAFANYEGMCLGKRLADGTRALLLVSDGDGYASERFYVFKLDVQEDEPRADNRR